MLIMNRDKELCRRLHSFGLLTTRQIAATLFPGIALTTILRRLRKLEEASYIRRIEGLHNNEKGWALTHEGANLVSVQNSKIHFRKDQLQVCDEFSFLHQTQYLKFRFHSFIFNFHLLSEMP